MGPIFHFVSFHFVSFRFPYGVIQQVIVDVYHILYTQPIRASMGSPASSHTAGPLSLAGGHALGAHRDPLKLKPSRQHYAGHNDCCPAIWMYASVPSRWDRGIPPNAWSHNMHEVPLVLQSSFNEYNPVSRFHAYMSFSFSFRYISYIFLAGLCSMQFTVFHVIQFIQLHSNTHINKL